MSRCSSWTWMSVSLPRLGKFSAIMSSNMFSAPPFLSFLSETPIMQVLVCLILSQRSLKLSSFLFIFFLLSVQHQWFLLLCLPAHWLASLYCLFYFWFLLVHFSLQLLYYSSLFGCSLYFPTLCYKLLSSTLCVHSSLEFFGHLYDHYPKLFLQ